jgi:ABC-2 type transport system ATP-binding protein
MDSVLSVSNLSKTYKSGFKALKSINLEIRKGEILALLGPNGAGKTTLISIICGIVNPSEGRVSVAGHDILKDFRLTRSMIGLVPQELTTDAFETVWATVSFSRGLFGKPANPEYVTKVLKDLSLWDKKDNKIRTLSGGMKRRVLIAKALAHEPQILFLDEPTAEEMADRIGVINHGELILVEEKRELMQKLGKKQLTLHLHDAIGEIPAALSAYRLERANGGDDLVYTYDTQGERTGITALLRDLSEAGIRFKDIETKQSSLEEIFVNLVKRPQ